MSSFTKFKKDLGLKSEEIENLTGYTRQGLHYGFKNLDNGIPTKKFLVCMSGVVNWKIAMETLQYENKVESFKKMQEALMQQA